MSEHLTEAFGFNVGQAVRMLCECSGDDCEGTYHRVEAGAEGTIDSIERFANDQGVNITVVIVTGKRDQNGEMLTIVNSFDELDGPPSKFFEAAKPDVYHLSQDDVQRIIAALMVMEDSDAELGHPEEAQKSRELAARLKAASGGN